jgi:Response regulator containing CheY-like receiver, AAA-type ATPase, and DNA-binding domains
MKKILLVEDNGSLSMTLIKKLEDRYTVERAYSYSSALGFWIEDKDYDCIILDLQINPNGLSLKEINSYAPIFGMAFLYKICEEKTPEEIKSIYKKTVIYSGFVKELKDMSRSKNWDISNIKIIAKTDCSINELIKNVERITK